MMPVLGRADPADKFKEEVAALLPVGTDQEKVRQFLKVRSLEFKEVTEEKTITVRILKKKGLFRDTISVTVFEFDAGGFVKAVRSTIARR
jgi:hypothetical protein